MRRIELLNGELEFIQEDAELMKLVEAYMGYDMSCVIKDLVGISNYTKEKINSDLISYEGTIEEQRESLIELQDMLDLLHSELDKSRINKEKMRALINRMVNVVNQNI